MSAWRVRGTATHAIRYDRSVGIALGLAIATLATRAFGALLWDVSATDHVTFVIASVVLAAVAVSAALVPAHRATTIDLVRTLKAE